MGGKPQKDTPFEKPRPLDYVLMIGGPLLFVAIAVFGILYLRGPVGGANPVQKLREGAVKPGMTFTQAIEVLGEPKAIVERPDGGTTLRYWHDTETAFEQDDGFVEVNVAGYVTSVNVERTRVPLPEESR